MNQFYKKKNITPTLISAALAAFIAQPSFAQIPEAQASKGMLEEILVTAQKRAFSAQLTPVALTAATGDTLRENGVASAFGSKRSVAESQRSLKQWSASTYHAGRWQ
tara:strand:- start:85 stop:405 length:321 start_codon:yes stop_codon:yes gene_type:complete